MVYTGLLKHPLITSARQSERASVALYATLDDAKESRVCNLYCLLLKRLYILVLSAIICWMNASSCSLRPLSSYIIDRCDLEASSHVRILADPAHAPGFQAAQTLCLSSS